MALIKNKFEVSKFFQALLVGFLAVQLISWITSIYFKDIPMLKGGPMLLLFLVVIGIISLFVLGKKIGELDLKKDLIFVILVFGGIVAAFIFLPQWIPQIFSTSGIEIGEYSRQTINTIIAMSPGGITPK